MWNHSEDVYSINYDFIPNYNGQAKCLWIDLRYPPENLKIGQHILLKSMNRNFVPPPENLIVKDIVGTKIVLTTDLIPRPSEHQLKLFLPKNDVTHWIPLDHGPQWGYSTRNHLTHGNKNWLFGQGNCIAKILW